MSADDDVDPGIGRVRVTTPETGGHLLASFHFDVPGPIAEAKDALAEVLVNRRCPECSWSTIAHHPDCPVRRVNHG